MENSPAISFNNVYFEQGGSPILTKANFTINRGEFVGVIGPNGGGKTTALKLIMGFLKPQKGSVVVLGRSTKENKTKIGYVPQMMDLDKAFPISVEEVIFTGLLSKVKWWGQLPKREREKSDEILEKLEIAPLRRLPFGSLSGGQMQKTLIARALVSHPDLLLLDEATANIDPNSEEHIFTVLKNLSDKPTILAVSHNFDIIIKHSEKILLFQQEVTSLHPEQLCRHFSMGMYHPLPIESNKEKNR